ncbi:alpha/beta hydrolase [Rhodalgimonas zhirmunskyi]|uniref:Alpha/beta hydrolase n=1 Tax=Rhodalgimonas zhirmunskyi TaxID=2964767 RepID=A0AAJ1UF64_9RHOB|nr:alpha/beta hydrolase [Rhodoalgimonas zhirmunskyi]MDQ2094817.1 alpha/beta hydrolase [Rhodoalgimonas zhirmunskyi]
MQTAPFYDDIADGPKDGAAYWLKTSDGLRIRVALWHRAAKQGTVLFFPGRTEYAEKYGRVASILAQRGMATLAIDWRGQGIADRMVDDPATGHVSHFLDYQKDVKAMVDAARALELPEPFYLMAHSMGGCIGLRALHEGLPVKAASFTGPMWGIDMAPPMRPVAWSLAWAGRSLGLGASYAPGTTAQGYVATAPFEDNQLTRDREMWDWMKSHLTAHPDLLLGGPSLRWLSEALREMRVLHKMPSPAQPAITFVGDNERIVDVDRIRSRMARWPNGRLDVIENGEHEVLMEGPERRTKIIDTALAFFAASAGTEAA